MSSSAMHGGNDFIKINIKSKLKGQSGEILISFFFTYIDRHRPQYESLLILKFVSDPHDLITKMTFFTKFRRNPFGKIIFFPEIFLISRNLFSEYFSYTLNLFYKPIFFNLKKVSESR
jgi:hypothetical protein